MYIDVLSCLVLLLYFSATTFSQIKMHGGDSARERAEDQLRTCVYGNWRKGMKAMGGATCAGGFVSMDEDVQLQDSPLVTCLHSIL